MVNKRLKQIIAAMSVTSAFLPFSMNAVTTYAADGAAEPITGLTTNQAQPSTALPDAAQVISNAPILKVVNKTPKTPVDEFEKNKQEVQNTLPDSSTGRALSGGASVSDGVSQEPVNSAARSVINSYAELKRNSVGEILEEKEAQSAGAEDIAPRVENLSVPSYSASASSASSPPSGLTSLSGLTDTLQQVNSLVAIPALTGTGVAGATVVGAGLAEATLTGLTVLGGTALTLGAVPAVTALGAITAATLAPVIPTAGLAVLGAGTALAVPAVAGAALTIVPVAGAALAGLGALGLGALDVAAVTTAAVASVPLGVGALAALAPIALGTAGLTAATAVLVPLGVGAGTLFTGHVVRRALELGILVTAGALFNVGGALIAGHVIRRAVEFGALGLLASGAVFGLAALTAPVVGALLFTGLAVPVVLGALALGALGVGGTLLAGHVIRRMIEFAALPLALGLAGITLSSMTGSAILAGLLFAGLLGAAGALVIGAALLSLGLAGITLFSVAGSAILAGLAASVLFGIAGAGVIGAALLSLGGYLLARLLTTPLSIPLGILTWGNIGRAWGRFIGSIIGAGASFVIAGILGSIFSLPFLRPAFAVLWQLICVPLWSVLGAFNGAVICTPIGVALGALLGLAVPVWSLAIGSWLVPIFALLWDSLATTQIVFTTVHLIAGLIGLPIGMLTWWNVGRAWGNFVGSWIGAAVSFAVAGLIGFTVGLPGLRIPFALLWQAICVPLWSVLGAFNGAVICGVLGTGLGAILGMTVPLWSILIGSWFVPLFALLWDSLATAEIIGAHLLSVASQWMVRYPLRWARMNAFVFIPGALKSLLNIVLLRYGPLFNHIHKITAFSDSVDSGWGSLGYLLYGKTVVANKPVLDSAPWLVGYALGAWVNQYSIPGGRTNEIRFLLDPFYLPDYNLRNQMEELSNGSISFWKLLLMKFFARMSVRTSQVVTINIGSNDLWVPIMAALYDIANDGRFGLLTTPERVALFGKWPTMIGNVVHYVLAWYIANALSSYNPTKPYFLLIKLAAGIVKEFTDYYINLPIILMHIFLLNPFATVVVEGTESPVRNWDVFPALDDNLIEYAMEPVYEIQNLYKRLLVLLYPGKAVYADMHGIQLKTERFAVPTFENLTLDDSGFDPHPSWIGRRQQADRILRALGQPSPYGWSESVYMRPSFLWNMLYPVRPTTFIHPLWARFRIMDGIHFRPLYNFQTILPSVTGKLPINY